MHNSELYVKLKGQMLIVLCNYQCWNIFIDETYECRILDDGCLNLATPNGDTTDWDWFCEKVALWRCGKNTKSE